MLILRISEFFMKEDTTVQSVINKPLLLSVGYLKTRRNKPCLLHYNLKGKRFLGGLTGNNAGCLESTAKCLSCIHKYGAVGCCGMQLHL